MIIKHAIVRALAIVAILVAVLIVIVVPWPSVTTERFTSSSDALPDALIPDLKAYWSCYSPETFDATAKKWSPLVGSSAGPLTFTSTVAPAFSATSGASLSGGQRAQGPKSDALGLSFNGPWTLLIACRHGRLVGEHAQPMELLRLYANSGNNNGVALQIAAGSVKPVPGRDLVQTGRLELRFGADPPRPCVVAANPDNSMDLPSSDGSVSVYAIVRQPERVSVYASDILLTPDVTKVLEFDAGQSGQNVTFSNRELEINANGNYSGAMFALAAVGRALTLGDIVAFRDHWRAKHLMRIDPNLPALEKSRDAARADLARRNACPYDAVTCRTCGFTAAPDGMSSSEWTMRALSSSSACRQSVAAHCSTAASSTSDACACWAPAKKDDRMCQAFRSIFTDDRVGLLGPGRLSTEELGYVQRAHGLVSAKAAAAAASAATAAAAATAQEKPPPKQTSWWARVWEAASSRP
jgi:hypothetical protein